jgi:hypothetical protein
VVLKGVGHAFPADYEPALREWVRQVAGLSKECTTHPTTSLAHQAE